MTNSGRHISSNPEEGVWREQACSRPRRSHRLQHRCGGACRGSRPDLAVNEQHEATPAVLVQAPETKDPYTGGHVARVARFAGYSGAELGFSPPACAGSTTPL